MNRFDWTGLYHNIVDPIRNSTSKQRQRFYFEMIYVSSFMISILGYLIFILKPVENSLEAYQKLSHYDPVIAGSVAMFMIVMAWFCSIGPLPNLIAKVLSKPLAYYYSNYHDVKEDCYK